LQSQRVGQIGARDYRIGVQFRNGQIDGHEPAPFERLNDQLAALGRRDCTTRRFRAIGQASAARWQKIQNAETRHRTTSA
jgi:hypothetical protein